jgi:hypothetical protein
MFKGGQPIGEFKTRNVSVGGALLAGQHALTIGDVVDGSLRFADRQSIRFRATVVRTGSFVDEQYVALAFSDLPPRIEEVIESVVDSALARARSASALILSDMVASRSDLELGLKAFGHTPVAIDSPLDAVNFLEQPNNVTIAFVDLTLCGGADGREVLAYIADERPKVRRVLVSEQEPLSQLTPVAKAGPPLANRFLVRPWSLTALASTLEGRD